jgi:DNA-binding MarR family transcriptional regulator
MVRSQGMGWITDLLKEIPSAARYKSELEQLESEHGILKSENTVLQSQLKAAEEKIRNLEEQLSDQHSQYLDETAVKILTFIAHYPDCTTETLAQHLGLHSEKVLYYRDELTQQGYFNHGLTWDDQEYYQLTPKGRKILNDRQLL